MEYNVFKASTLAFLVSFMQSLWGFCNGFWGNTPLYCHNPFWELNFQINYLGFFKFEEKLSNPVSLSDEYQHEGPHEKAWRGTCFSYAISNLKHGGF